ncbi:3-deoxy-manno-octulosonate cytidylyltransferase [Allomuricauda ruestringensis DSM 13258]|uniref:3-deoxy-manno-octulosonate cytidylyltransferase n=1 Tax=Allomuricauda ruestringensis (strain DSM 13258 / CIP 107369 / LMG 19739 / B1) TaxID=886377 RepID=G2PPH2_ALLRU|nr:3-deoxy-manno-octulosonate cytidylyltransferase [Allomuricauda ruestringensis]AEM71473.1 3-deoxy-manno-octulosonate cytidylyltransferase [Allomuricauda ruestringensis DSM 13258]
MIPARYQASRFPAKLMQDLGGKPVIVRTYEAAVNTGLFSEVYVVTDSPIISDVIKEIGGNVIMSKTAHESGSDRIAEAVEDMDVDIVINVQGDEPFIDAESLEKIIKVFKNDTAKEIDLGSLMTPITDWDEISNPNTVKVIVDNQGFALYFSRSPIPYPRDKEVEATYYKHKGVYVFRKRALMDFKKLPMLPLEAKEKIEAIRFLEYGRKIKMVETHVTGIEIDTPEDLDRARKIWK